MTIIDLRLVRANRARDAGRYEEALSLLQDVYAERERVDKPTPPDYFMLMFQWEMLLPLHPPARLALAQARDAQTARLLDGDLLCGSSPGQDKGIDAIRRVPRFFLIVEMNEMLGDSGSTHALFVALEAKDPAMARRHAGRALPAMIEVADFARADRYHREPLGLLDEVKRYALSMPLFPAKGQAPRLAAELSNLVKDVRIGAAVLDGLGRPAEALALRQALLEGLQDDLLRSMAQRELDEPGTINRALVEHGMAHD